jgi:hypothetical protein
VSDGRIRIVERFVAEAQVVVSARELRVARQCVVEVSDRRRVLPGIVVETAHPIAILGILRVVPTQALQLWFRPIATSEADIGEHEREPLFPIERSDGIRLLQGDGGVQRLVVEHEDSRDQYEQIARIVAPLDLVGEQPLGGLPLPFADRRVDFRNSRRERRGRNRACAVRHLGAIRCLRLNPRLEIQGILAERHDRELAIEFA